MSSLNIVFIDVRQRTSLFDCLFSFIILLLCLYYSFFLHSIFLCPQNWFIIIFNCHFLSASHCLHEYFIGIYRLNPANTKWVHCKMNIASILLTSTISGRMFNLLLITVDRCAIWIECRIKSVIQQFFARTNWPVDNIWADNDVCDNSLRYHKAAALNHHTIFIYYIDTENNGKKKIKNKFKNRRRHLSSPKRVKFPKLLFCFFSTKIT